MEYLIDSDKLRYFWNKKDFYTILHFASNDAKIWEFSIPILMQSHLAKRWFYQERETYKCDIFYRL